MKKYRLTAFLISFCLAIAVCMLSIDLAYSRQPSTQLSSEMGLPQFYYKITAEFSGSSMELSENTILDKLFEAVSVDPEAIAIFTYGPLYLYDPSGYYNTEEVNGGYFSKEDFLSGSEEGVIITQDSPYSLMKENGRVYCLGKYRDVVGECDDDHPLFLWGGNDVIRCLGPGYLPQKGIAGDSVYSQKQFYLANCEKDIFDKAKDAFAEAGWTVTEADALRGGIYGSIDTSYYLKYLYRNDFMVILLLIVMGALVLRRAACTGRKSTYTFGKGFSYGIIPSLAGCLAGNTVTALGRWFVYYSLFWGGVLSATGIVMFIMLLLMAGAWIGTGKNEKGTPCGTAARIKKVCVPVMAIVFSCLTVWLSYDDINSIKNEIKQMISDNMISEVNGVQFRTMMPGNIKKDTGEKLAGFIEQAIKEGKAFAFIQSYDFNSIVIGSEAFGKACKLDLAEELPAAYASKSFEGFKNWESIGVGKYAKNIDVPVVKYLNNDVYNGLIKEFTDNSGPMVIMDLEDFMESGYDIIDAADNMCFVNADSRTLNQYAEWLDELGCDYDIDRFGHREDDYYRIRLSVYGLSVIYIVMKAVTVLLFLAAAVNLTADRKNVEIKTALLYGAGFKEIWLKLLMLSAEILVPVGGIIGVIPKLRSYYGFISISSQKQKDLIKLMVSALLKDMAKGMAAGLLLVAVIGAALAWGIWREHRDSSQLL